MTRRRIPKMPVLRYQDRSGRGPFRPGVPAMWADEDGDSPPSVFERFPDLMDTLQRICASGGVVGCACIGWGGLHQYFTEAERGRLHCLGYRVHRVPSSAVLIHDNIEAVFAVRRPLKTLPRAKEPRP